MSTSITIEKFSETILHSYSSLYNNSVSDNTNVYTKELLASWSDPSDFEFERYKGLPEVLEFMGTSWPIAFTIGVAYLGGIFYLQHWMRDRKPMELKSALIMWNILIGLFSIMGFIRSAPELLKFAGTPNGFYASICTPNFTYRFIFWSTLFALSKIPELLDTVFVVLRKKPLEALQWYHHVVTMFGCYTFISTFEPASRYMVVINFGVHGIMYPYFALKVAGVNVPRYIAKIITTCQFTQMVVCMIANAASAYLYLSGAAPCHRTPLAILYSVFVNITFLVMFGDLFVKLVVQSKRVSRKKVE